jgi:hypothetical protein
LIKSAIPSPRFPIDENSSFVPPRALSTKAQALVHDERAACAHHAFRVQQSIPGNTFHTARVTGSRRWFLGASTAWPGVTAADAEIGDVEALAGRYPAVADELRAIAASVVSFSEE